MSKQVNIMDILTPKPPFNPARKNEAVKFRIPSKSVGLVAPMTVLKGINRTKATNPLK